MDLPIKTKDEITKNNSKYIIQKRKNSKKILFEGKFKIL
jgi:hypothetical protein